MISLEDIGDFEVDINEFFLEKINMIFQKYWWF